MRNLFKRLAAFAALALVSGTALAGSGSPVTTFLSTGTDNPFCVLFQTQYDGAWYAFSLADPGAALEADAVGYSRKKFIEGASVPLNFEYGTPPSWANPMSNGTNKDCDMNSGFVYVWRMYY
jgi:hypothetical protein